jgi:hypothetical protein
MIMNYIDKLDQGLIRPGGVEIRLKFDVAGKELVITISGVLSSRLLKKITPAEETSSVRSFKRSSTESKTIETNSRGRNRRKRRQKRQKYRS